MPDSDRLEQLRKIAQGGNDIQPALSDVERIAAMRSATSVPGRLTSFSDQSQSTGRIVTESDQSLGNVPQNSNEDK